MHLWLICLAHIWFVWQACYQRFLYFQKSYKRSNISADWVRTNYSCEGTDSTITVCFVLKYFCLSLLLLCVASLSFLVDHYSEIVYYFYICRFLVVEMLSMSNSLVIFKIHAILRMHWLHWIVSCTFLGCLHTSTYDSLVWLICLASEPWHYIRWG